MNDASHYRYNFKVGKGAVLSAAFDVGSEMEVIVCGINSGPDDRRWGHSNRGSAYGTSRLPPGDYYAWAQFKSVAYDDGGEPWSGANFETRTTDGADPTVVRFHGAREDAVSLIIDFD